MSDIEAALRRSRKTPYTGRELSAEERKRYKLKPYSPYLPSEGLKNAVNLAIFLEKRPLLLKGEPGCGKTRLAEAVAIELGLKYYPWYVKSTTRAKDGLYVFDALRRLQDAQVGRTSVGDLRRYIRGGPLGLAFENPQRSVVLIDEIDKADIDFPNDLLRELDEQRFAIEETGDEIIAKQPPIVFVTSNDEKDLPDAFLRRCLFYYIPFPDKEELAKIVASHFPKSDTDLVEAAVDRFWELRQDMKSSKGKKVSTSELLDWFAVLQSYPDKKEALDKLPGLLPFPETLLKRWEDRDYIKAKK